MFDLAIIGGMGPEATVELFRRIVKKTAATCDQEHMKISIFNDPTIPDRTAHILRGEASPLDGILKNIALAKECGCRYFAIPCNTSHYFSRTFHQVEGIHFVDMVQQTCRYLKKCYADKTVCILATEGTVAADVYGKNDSALPVVYPSKESCRMVMQTINKIKCGDYDLQQLAQALQEQLRQEFDMENTVFVLACTELSLLLPYMQFAVDALEVLALSIIKTCGYQVKPNSSPLSTEDVI